MGSAQAPIRRGRIVRRLAAVGLAVAAATFWPSGSAQALPNDLVCHGEITLIVITIPPNCYP